MPVPAPDGNRGRRLWEGKGEEEGKEGEGKAKGKGDGRGKWKEDREIMEEA